jgi:flagellar assembly factor FliW
MRNIETSRFGTLRYEEEEEIGFPRGLPGFETECEFVLLEQPGSSPFLFLQSVNRPGLCFVTVPVPLLVPTYELGLSADDSLTLEVDQTQDSSGLDVLAIVCAIEDQPATVNLLGPIVINRRSRRGVQTIREDDRYSARHPIAKEPGPCS